MTRPEFSAASMRGELSGESFVVGGLVFGGAAHSEAPLEPAVVVSDDPAGSGVLDVGDAGLGPCPVGPCRNLHTLLAQDPDGRLDCMPLGAHLIDEPERQRLRAKYADDSMWQLSVSDTDPDAWPEVQAASEWNEPPAEGESFVSTVLTITTESDASPEGVDPGVSLSTEYVTANGRSYDARMCSINNAPPPGVIYEIGAMYPEATADAYLCAAVPTEDVKGGTWRIGYIAGEQSVFFTGAR